MRKKLLGLVLTLSTIISLFVPCMSAQAAIGINHELQVSLMAALGIVPGYPDNYDANAKLTAQEFVSYTYAAVDTELGSAESVVSGFGLDATAEISYEQAANVILSVAGYLPVAGNDPYTYAQANKIFSGVTNAARNASVTVESAAIMLYNMLDMKYVEYNTKDFVQTSRTIMEEKLNVYEMKGIVTATNETGLKGYSNTSKTTVRIDDEIYNIGTTGAQTLLGRYVKFFYKDDKKSGEKVIKWIEVEASRTQTSTIYGYDVVSASPTTIIYDLDKGRNRTARIAQNAQVIYNGVYSDKTVEAVTSPNCEATLISNDGSSSYNIVIINDYNYYMVDSFAASSLVVNDYSSQQTLDVDEQNYTAFSIYKDGVRASVSDIAAGQVLAAVISEKGNVASIEILSGSVSGEITTSGTDAVTIGGESYDISAAYVGDRLKMGRNGTFYFDKLGKIVRCSALRAQTSQYGYLIKYFSDTDGESDFTARMLTANGSVTEFKVRDSVSFNDSKRSSKDVYNLIDAGNNCKQLISYAVNGSNEIIKINTADKKYLGVDEENVDEFTLNYTGTGKYRKNNLCFNSKYLIDSSTPIFIIPYDGEVDEYAVKNASYLKNGTIYNISVYDIDEYMYASAIVMQENITEPENLRNKRPMVITKVLESAKDDGDTGWQIEGYQQGSKVSYFLANDNMKDNRGIYSVKDLSEGDVIIYGTNAKGEVNVVQLMYRAKNDRLYIASGTTAPCSYWEGGTSVFPDLWASCGKVVNRNAELIMVDDDGNEDKISKSPHLLGSCVTYLCENGKVTVSNKNEISVGDTVYVHEYQGKVNDVLIVR